MATQQAEFPIEQTELITEQTELIEKLNCLESETSQLNRAYQLWRSYVEQGTDPEWMDAAITITYNALIFPTEQTELIEELNCLELETSQLHQAYQLWRSYVEQGTAPDWMAAAITITYNALTNFYSDTVLAIQPDVPHAYSPSRLEQLDAAACEISDMLGEESTTAEPASELLPPELLPVPEPETDWTEPEMPVAISPPSIWYAIGEQPAVAIQQIQQEEESTIVEPSPELLHIPEPEPDWAEPEMPGAIFPRSTGDRLSEQPAIAIQQVQQEEVAVAEPAGAGIHSLTALTKWLLGSSTGILFFVPPGTMGRLFRVSVAILIVAGLAIGIYLVRAEHAALTASEPVQNSASQGAAGAVAIPTGEKAEVKFDRDPVVAPLGSSFVLNAVLSRGSDISSVAVQIDYDPNLLQFMGISEGGFLVKAGRKVVVAQGNDPLTGVLKISAEESPGKPGISGDGSVFALSFRARQRGKGTVSIVPSVHDSQGQRIEMAGSQVSVKVN